MSNLLYYTARRVGGGQKEQKLFGKSLSNWQTILETSYVCHSYDS